MACIETYRVYRPRQYSAVYFNPAKTIGAMIEADLYVLLGLVYTSVISLAAMAMYWFFELKPGWEWLADLIVISWIGMSMSVIAFLKVWMVSIFVVPTASVETTIDGNIQGQSLFQYRLQHDGDYHLRCVRMGFMVGSFVY